MDSLKPRARTSKAFNTPDFPDLMSHDEVLQEMQKQEDRQARRTCKKVHRRGKRNASDRVHVSPAPSSSTPSSYASFHPQPDQALSFLSIHFTQFAKIVPLESCTGKILPSSKPPWHSAHLKQSSCHSPPRA